MTVATSGRGRLLVLGARGQLGRSLLHRLPRARGLGPIRGLARDTVDLTDAGWPERVDLDGVDTIINAAAYTDVDAAQTPRGRNDAWATNVTGVARLVHVCRDRGVRLVHLSSDYVFDGQAPAHEEAEPLRPLGVYGQTKAAGDTLVAEHDPHYLVRTSWVIGDGKNFVRTMTGLADQGACPAVVDDQRGRLTFSDDLADAIAHLLLTGAEPGTYHMTNSGPVRSWADIAADVFELRGRSRQDVRRVSTAQYTHGRTMASRPRHSTLTLHKLRATGFTPAPAATRLRAYVRALPAGTPPRVRPTG